VLRGTARTKEFRLLLFAELLPDLGRLAPASAAVRRGELMA